MADEAANVNKPAGLMGGLTDALATLTRYSVTLPLYPLKIFSEKIQGGVQRPVSGLLDLTTLLPRALVQGLEEAKRQITGDTEGEPTLTRPGLLTYRDQDQEAAIIFIHGFYMNMENTWGEFPQLIAEEPQLAGWDVYSMGYATNFWIDIAGLWKASPPIDRLSSLLETTTRNEPFKRYKTLALVAHSMGGLVVQRALVDSGDLRGRVSHVNMYGTPSNGLKKAGVIKFWKRQIRDMAAGSEFVTDLRQRWRETIGEKPPFRFLAAAGDQDELVPPNSSLEPFPKKSQAVIAGDHLTIVNVHDASDLAVQVLVGSLTDSAAPGGPWNSARVAVESRDFQRAIDDLWPHRAELDEATLITLSLALSSVRRQEDAIKVLRESKNATTDLMGTLAGRLKRRWLEERRKNDAEEALKLYEQALEEAEKAKDSEQVYYHAINVAFMWLAYRRKPGEAKKYARKALDHCEKSPAGLWRFATEGEANLVLGHDEAALEGYRQSLETMPKPWQVASMYEQAVRVTEMLNNSSMADQLREIFREGSTVKDAEADLKD